MRRSRAAAHRLPTYSVPLHRLPLLLAPTTATHSQLRLISRRASVLPYGILIITSNYLSVLSSYIHYPHYPHHFTTLHTNLSSLSSATATATTTTQPRGNSPP